MSTPESGLTYAQMARAGVALPLLLYLRAQADGAGHARIVLADFAALAAIPYPTAKKQRASLARVLTDEGTPVVQFTPCRRHVEARIAAGWRAQGPETVPNAAEGAGVDGPKVVPMPRKGPETVPNPTPGNGPEVVPVQGPELVPRVRATSSTTLSDVAVADPDRSSSSSSRETPGSAEAVVVEKIDQIDQLLYNTPPLAAATVEIPATFDRANWDALDAPDVRALPPLVDDEGGLWDDVFGAAAGTGGIGLHDAPRAAVARVEAPQAPSVDAEPLLAALRALTGRDRAARAWLPRHPAGGVDAGAVRRDLATLARCGATVARLGEVVAAARPAEGEPKPWAWVVNTLRRNPTKAPASAGGARRAGRPQTEVRPDKIDPATLPKLKRKGW